MKSYWNFLCLLVLTVRVAAATLPPGFAEMAVAEGLNPTAMALAPDGSVFLAQKDGRVLILHADGQVHAQPFLTLDVDDFNERGLEGIALHPNFEMEPWVYLYYTVKGDAHNRVSRVLANGDFAVPGSEQILLELDPLGGAIHNGGALAFGPDDNLYIGTGDGAVPANAQNLNSLLGKILRLTPAGGIPATNPFYNQLTGSYRAIYAYGVRNPFSMSCDPGSGRIFFCDVGNGAWEEVNELKAGKNYGWSSIEGPIGAQTPPANYQEPFFAYPHSDGCAVVGAAFGFANHPAIPAAFQGKFFFADYCKGWIKILDPLTGALTGELVTGIDRPVSLLATPNGELYYFARAGLGGGSPGDNTASTEGTLWKIFWIGNGAPQITGQPRDVFIPAGENARFDVQAFGALPVVYQWLKNNAPVPGSTGPVLNLENVPLTDSGAVFTCIAANTYGADTSEAATLRVTSNRRPFPEIFLPSAGTGYRCGDTLHFSGTAFDPEEGALPANRLRWRIDFYHADHTHPAMSPVEGVSEGTFYIPTVGETAADVFFRVFLSAEDDAGLVKTVWRDVQPELTDIRLTGPVGMPVNVDGQIRNLPVQIESVINIERHLQATEFQQVGDTIYVFRNWSDGQTTPLYNLLAPESPTELVLFYDRYTLGNGDGLRGEYFFDPAGDLSGMPELVRLDTTVNFDWMASSPAPDILPVDYFTARWTGTVQPVFSDTYTFSVSSDDGCRLWVGDSLLIDKWKPQATTEHAGIVTLEGGKKYPIRLEYLEIGGGANVQLFWKSTLQPKEIIPKRQLYQPDTVHTAVLRGTTGIDQDLDGQWETGEPVLPGVVVSLFDAATDSLIAMRQTLANGRYEFLQLGPGDYYLRVAPPATSDLLQPSENLDADGFTPVFSLAVNEMKTLNTAWIVAQMALYGSVWLDENRNANWENSEPGLENIAVLLYRADSGFVAATATNAGGGYLFSLIQPGDYFMLFSKQLISVPLAPGHGLNPNGQTPVFEMMAGQGREVKVAFEREEVSDAPAVSDQAGHHLVLYPNPAHDRLWAMLDVAEEQEVLLEIWDMAGRVVWQQLKQAIAGRNEWVLPVGGLETGVYALACRTANGVKIKMWSRH